MESNNNRQIEFLNIPNDWESYYLGCTNPKLISELRNGLTVKQTKGGGKFKITRIETISDCKIDEERVRYINEISKEIINKFVIKKGDILFSHINSDSHLGKTAIAKKNYKDLLHGMNLLLFRANQEIIDPKYLNFVFNYYRTIGVFLKIRSRAVNQSSINQNKLRNLEIPLPPLQEQYNITYVLDIIQKAIEKQDQLIKTTSELKKALMQKLFTEGLRGEKQKQTEIGLVPESWKVVELGKYAEILNGYAFKSTDYVKKGVRLIRIGNVSFGYLIEKDDVFLPNNYIKSYQQYSLGNGDLILSLTRPITSGGMKYCFVEKKHLPALLNQRVGKFQVNSPRITKEYLYHIIFSNYFVDELKIIAEGSNQPNVSPNKLEKILIPIPSSTSEQEDICKYLSCLNIKINFIKNKIKKLEELFSVLLQQLMTGQIRVDKVEF